MKICAISDTHNLHRHFGHEPWGNLPEADILIHCGDVTTHGTEEELDTFLRWFSSLNYRNKIFVAGNHDRCLEDYRPKTHPSVHYLRDEMVSVGGIMIYGTPAHRKFQDFPFGITDDEDTLKVPPCDILITHGPPFGICDDEVKNRDDHFGSMEILRSSLNAAPRLHLFGHVHHARTRVTVGPKTTYMNCAIHQWLWKKNPIQIPVTIEIQTSSPAITPGF